MFTRSHCLMYTHACTNQCYRIWVAACILSCTFCKTALFHTLASSIFVHVCTSMYSLTGTYMNTRTHRHVQGSHSCTGSQRAHLVRPIYTLLCMFHPAHSNSRACMCVDACIRGQKSTHLLRHAHVHRCGYIQPKDIAQPSVRSSHSHARI